MFHKNAKPLTKPVSYDKIYKIKDQYKADLEAVKCIKGKSVYLVMPAILKTVIFTKKDIENETGLSRNSVSNIIEQLVQLDIIEHDVTYTKWAYKYKKIYTILNSN